MRFKVGDTAIYAFPDCKMGEKYMGQLVTIEGLRIPSDAGPVRDYQLDVRTRIQMGPLEVLAVLLCDDWQLRKPDDPTFNFEDEETELEEELCSVR